MSEKCGIYDLFILFGAWNVKIQLNRAQEHPIVMNTSWVPLGLIFEEKEERQTESVIALLCIFSLISKFLFLGMHGCFVLIVKLTKFFRILGKKIKKAHYNIDSTKSKVVEKSTNRGQSIAQKNWFLDTKTNLRPIWYKC